MLLAPLIKNNMHVYVSTYYVPSLLLLLLSLSLWVPARPLTGNLRTLYVTQAIDFGVVIHSHVPGQIPFPEYYKLTCHQQEDETIPHYGSTEGWRSQQDPQGYTTRHLEQTGTQLNSPSIRSSLLPHQLRSAHFLYFFKWGKSQQKEALTGIKTAEEPGIVGLGRVPGMEAGMGCLCLLWRWSREDREPGTGLGTKKKKRKEKIANIIPDILGRGFTASFSSPEPVGTIPLHEQQIRFPDGSHIIEDIREIITNKI